MHGVELQKSVSLGKIMNACAALLLQSLLFSELSFIGTQELVLAFWKCEGVVSLFWSVICCSEFELSCEAFLHTFLCIFQSFQFSDIIVFWDLIIDCEALS